MKQFFNKRVLALLCIVTCMLSMTACSEDLGSRMANAAVNTVIGMGIVFAVLILMIWIISLFKYIPMIQAKFEKKKTSETKTVSTPVTSPEVMEEENLVDDLELVAVITAAIAAMENTSADGLVVRSIKRSANNKWKRS